MPAYISVTRASIFGAGALESGCSTQINQKALGTRADWCRLTLVHLPSNQGHAPCHDDRYPQLCTSMGIAGDCTHDRLPGRVVVAGSRQFTRWGAIKYWSGGLDAGILTPIGSQTAGLDRYCGPVGRQSGSAITKTLLARDDPFAEVRSACRVHKQHGADRGDWPRQGEMAENRSTLIQRH